MLSVVVVLAVPPLRLITAIIRMTLDIVSQLFNRLSAGVWLLASGNCLLVSGCLKLVGGVWFMFSRSQKVLCH
jgi:hypothetical protein